MAGLFIGINYGTLPLADLYDILYTMADPQETYQRICDPKQVL
jgi:hypothetical protein